MKEKEPICGGRAHGTPTPRPGHWGSVRSGPAPAVLSPPQPRPGSRLPPQPQPRPREARPPSLPRHRLLPLPSSSSLPRPRAQPPPRHHQGAAQAALRYRPRPVPDAGGKEAPGPLSAGLLPACPALLPAPTLHPSPGRGQWEHLPREVTCPPRRRWALPRLCPLRQTPSPSSRLHPPRPSQVMQADAWAWAWGWGPCELGAHRRPAAGEAGVLHRLGWAWPENGRGLRAPSLDWGDWVAMKGPPLQHMWEGGGGMFPGPPGPCVSGVTGVRAARAGPRADPRAPPSRCPEPPATEQTV